MYKLFREIAKKILLTEKAKKELKKVFVFYDNQAAKGAYDEWLDIREALSDSDIKGLETLANNVRRNNVKIVELGSWKGHSTSILARAVKEYNGNVYAIDHWQGSQGVWNYQSAKQSDVYSIFRRNIIALGLWDYVHPMVMTSQTASEIFKDGIIDMVFIDADHSYEHIKQDIISWLPKVKKGGIICGHDCEGYYSKYLEEDKHRVDSHLKDDFIETVADYLPPGEQYTRKSCHPGVVKAVYDIFRGEYQMAENSTIWYRIKE